MDVLLVLPSVTIVVHVPLKDRSEDVVSSPLIIWPLFPEKDSVSIPIWKVPDASLLTYLLQPRLAKEY